MWGSGVTAAVAGVAGAVLVELLHLRACTAAAARMQVGLGTMLPYRQEQFDRPKSYYLWVTVRQRPDSQMEGES